MPTLPHRTPPASATLFAALVGIAPAADAQTPVRKDGAATRVATPIATPIAARIDSLARAFVAAGQAPGVSYAVLRGTDTVAIGGHGHASAARRTPASATTEYRVGSVAKQFTAALVMRLVERGRVSLDDPIGRHVPDLPAAWRDVPVRHLLDHTSGIPSYTNKGGDWIARLRRPLAPRELVAITADDTLDFAPGTRWSYNNTGYVVLGMLLERAHGRPYATLVRGELAEPLGLATVRYCDDADTTRAAVARAHTMGPDGFVPAPYLHMSTPHAAGGLCASAGDVARWNRLLATGEVVRPASYRAMTTPGPVAARAPLKYGFGLAVDTLERHAMVTHGGAILGFMAANAWFPDDSLSITVLANAAPSDPDRLLRDIAHVALGLPLAAPAPMVALSAAERARYVGDYELRLPDRAMGLRVFAQGEKLYGQGDGQTAFELVPHGNHVFGASMDPGLTLAFTVDGERATGFALRQGGMSFPAVRRP